MHARTRRTSAYELVGIEPLVEAVLLAGQDQYHFEPAFSLFSFARITRESR